VPDQFAAGQRDAEVAAMFWTNYGVRGTGYTPAQATGHAWRGFLDASTTLDPPVAVVDTNVDKKGTRHAAEAYLGFLYSPEGRAIIAKHHYRPWGENPPLSAVGEAWPAIVAFDISLVGGWEAATPKFFGEGGVFDAIYQPNGG
jgi:ABC-type sulfate transport system substrate-binding protein